jgi:hypothetical protein
VTATRGFSVLDHTGLSCGSVASQLFGINMQRFFGFDGLGQACPSPTRFRFP